MAGAMSWVSERNLVAAMSNAGGFGVIACGAMTVELLDKEIAATKALTDKPFGVNLTILPTITPPPYAEYVKAIVESGIRIVETAGSKPKQFVEFFKEAGVTVFKPPASTAVNKPSGNLLIAIRENGDIWMDRRRIEMRDVRTLMERLHIERPDDTVVIIADKASGAGVVAKVMDEVRLAGILDVSIAADPNGG